MNARIAIGLGLVLALGTTAAGGGEPAKAAKPSEAFRREHAALREHLGHLEAWVGSLHASPPDARATMASVLTFLREHLLEHAGGEEKALYPAVDRRTGGTPAHPFTASMRHEHRIVHRWVEALAAEAAKPVPDARAFARRADMLLGLVAAHFEEEEEVLLPILDASMTAEEFEREILGPAHGK